MIKHTSLGLISSQSNKTNGNEFDVQSSANFTSRTDVSVRKKWVLFDNFWLMSVYKIPWRVTVTGVSILWRIDEFFCRW